MTATHGPKQRTLGSLLTDSWGLGRFLCVGLDPDEAMMPPAVLRDRPIGTALVDFGRSIVEATHEHVCAYKPNSAFYEAHGSDGLAALVDTVRFIRTNHPDKLVILDAKRADIGNTNRGYVRAAFDIVGADAITLHPYLGGEALTPFLDEPSHGVFVLVKTSNPGSGEFQDLPVGPHGRPLYRVVAEQVATKWNRHGNCGVVVGATYPSALEEVRGDIGDLPILIPGVGRQGGEIGPTVRAGASGRGGIVVNSSRDVIYASRGDDYAQAAGAAARTLNDQIAGNL